MKQFSKFASKRLTYKNNLYCHISNKQIRIEIGKKSQSKSNRKICAIHPWRILKYVTEGPKEKTEQIEVYTLLIDRKT